MGDLSIARTVEAFDRDAEDAEEGWNPPPLPPTMVERARTFAVDATGAVAETNPTRGERAEVRLRGTQQTLLATESWTGGSVEVARELRRGERTVSLRQTTDARFQGTLSDQAQQVATPQSYSEQGSSARVRMETVASLIANADGSLIGMGRTMASGAMRIGREGSEMAQIWRTAVATTGAHTSHTPEIDARAAEYRAQHTTRLRQLVDDGFANPSHDRFVRRHKRHRRRLQRAYETGLEGSLDVASGIANATVEPLPYDIPKHVQENSVYQFLTQSISWRTLARDAIALADAEHDRMRWWSEGAEGEPPESDSLVVRALGSTLPPSAMGRALRATGHAIRFSTFPEWETSGRMQAAVERHREGTPVDHNTNGGELAYNPFRAGQSSRRNLLDGRFRGGMARRILEEQAESFGKGLFGGVLTVPMSEGAGQVQNNTASAIEGLLSYAIFNVFLCYLYKPESGPAAHNSRQPGDGQEIRVHRSSHMCFPAVPLTIPVFPNFTELTGLDAESLKDMPIDEICGSLMTARWLVDHADSLSARLGFNDAGRTSMRRMVQNPAGFVTVVRNLKGAFTATTVGTRTAHAACAISRLNGLLWTISLLFVLLTLYLACCWPCTNIVSMSIRYCGRCCFDRRRSGRRRRRGRN